MMSITIYTMPKCEACERTKMWLDEQGFGFTEVDITEDEEAMELVKSHGYNQAPVVSINNFEYGCYGFRRDKLNARL